MLISHILSNQSCLNFTTRFHTSLGQDPTLRYEENVFLNSFWLNGLEMAGLVRF